MNRHGEMAFPLHWPVRKARTAASQRRANPLWRKATVSTACHQIEVEVDRMGGDGLVISTNCELRMDGWPRSDRRAPDDPGVAVYFHRKGSRIALACDLYRTVAENLRAIGMHLEAMRGQERWGVGSLDQAFAGYAALPETAGGEPWWQVLGLLTPPQSVEALQAAFRAAAKASHPDAGGSDEQFRRVAAAYVAGKSALGAA
jgi:hypothetical protein